MNALVINNTGHVNLAWDICLKLLDNGLLAKPTHTNIIRFAPPLVMTEAQLMDCVDIIINTIQEFEKTQDSSILIEKTTAGSQTK